MYYGELENREWTPHDSLSGSGDEKENWSGLSNTVNFKE